MTMKRLKGQRGSTMAEFAIVAGVFFMIVFGIIEFGRLLYTHNALTDAARRGARYAALHHEADIACVKNVVVYGETHVDMTSLTTCPALAGSTPLISRLATTNVVVTYEGADADNNPATPPTDYGMNLGTVTVSITGYSYNLNIPFFHQTLTMPTYTTTLTAEAAGEKPADITP